MAATRSDIPLPAGTWVNLNVVSGIAVGTVVTIYNKGSQPILIAQSSSAPLSSSLGIPVVVNGSLPVATGALALWAYSSGTGGNVLIQD